MLKTSIYFFLILSGIGLLLSLAFHVALLLGVAGADNYTGVLTVGMIVVWASAIAFTVFWNPQRFLAAENPRRDVWKVILSRVPAWITYSMYGFLGYAWINFFLAAASGAASAARGFSGVLMVFYSAAFILLYSASESQAR